MKQCRSCKEWRRYEEYWPAKRNKDNKEHICKHCRNNRRRLTEDQILRKKQYDKEYRKKQRMQQM